MTEIMNSGTACSPNFRYWYYFEKLNVPDGLFSIIMVCFGSKGISYVKPSLAL